MLNKIYSDKTHFIFEIIQNAEDACKRLSKKGIRNKFFINFQLFSDKLEIRHNGDPFNYQDISSICGIVDSTKKDDPSQIGRFGVGFKSVYAYTNNPQIYSDNKSFCIKNYVQPYIIPYRKDVKPDETLIVIPFDKPDVTFENAHKEIKNRLMKLGLRTLLFLSNISEISWSVFNQNGKYYRTIIGEEKGAKWMRLSRNENDKFIEKEEWILFEKKYPDIPQGIEIAFLCENKRIVAANNTRLYAYFETGLETHLKFNIHGPYQTTLSRDTIEINQWNSLVINRTAEMIADTIPVLKEMNLLNTSCLTALPTQYGFFSTEMSMFKPIYTNAVKKFSGDMALLPAYKGGFTSAKKAIISRGEPLRALLSPVQLKLLLKEEYVWLSEDITRDKTSDLFDYLQKELKIAIFTPEDFANKISEDFLKQQTVEWVISFYGFLLDEAALWREKTEWQSEGALRSKPIIKLSNNRFTKPFESVGKPLAYLHSKHDKMFPQLVDERVISNDKAKEFLKRLGLREPDAIAGIMEHILPQYKNKVVSEEDNIKHVTWIISTISTSLTTTHKKGRLGPDETVISLNDKRKEKLFHDLQTTPFLYCTNLASGKKEYKAVASIYLGSEYTGDITIEVFFAGNSSIYLLDSRYKNIGNIKQMLGLLGCQTKINVICKSPSYSGYVILENEFGWHRRGLDSFDPACWIEGVEFAIANINTDRARIIWAILREHYKQIYGEIESCTRREFLGSKKVTAYSRMGKLLTTNNWIPDPAGKYHKPSELYLTDLPDELQNYPESKAIAEKLGFKTEIKEEVLSHFNDDVQEFVKLIYLNQGALKGKNGELLRDFIKRICSPTTLQRITPTQTESGNNDHGGSKPYRDINEAKSAFEDSLSIKKDHRGVTRPKHWASLSPEDEDNMTMQYGRELPSLIEKIKSVTNTYIRKNVHYDNGTDPREFLYAEYGGRCQVCNAKLDIGADRPIFNMMRLVDTKNDYVWSNMEFNVICLCPNHFMLAKYGGREFNAILEKAHMALDHQVAAEPITERDGDFYVIKVNIAGKDEEVHYSQKHLLKLSAFMNLKEVPTSIKDTI